MSRAGTKQYRLGVSRYERVASMLLALLTLVGVSVSVMLVIWLTNRIFASTTAVPVTMEEIGDDEDPWGPGDDIEPPAPEETDLVEEEIEETLDAVADAVATRAAMLESRASGDGTGRGGGGTGHGRKGKPRRWEVMFDRGLTLEAYAQQLEFFGIELGVLRPNNQVEYAFNLTRSRPSRRPGPADQENRYYLTWRKGDLQQADRTLLSRAGIQVGRSLILKFLKPETEQAMYALEQAQANGRKVRSTVFGIRKGSSQPYEFYIVRQTYE